ncbi:MAG: TRAP transporter TatT component family protein [Saccharospirillum sp.]
MRVILILVLVVSTLSGCAVRQLPDNLASAIVDSDDLNTVQDGLPSYLLMLDALVETYPRRASLKRTAATLNGAYAGVFIPDSQSERRKALSAKALNYAFDAFCTYDDKACDLRELSPRDLPEAITHWQGREDLPYLYTLGTNWASYIQNHSDDWLAVAQLGQAEAVLRQAVSIDATYEYGTALLYLGVMNSILPPSLGGKPDVAEQYYEQAMAVSRGRNLIVPLYYAQQYARLMFDRELHDRLLQELLSQDPYVEGLTLQNVYAQREAQRLLAQADDYF